MDYPINKITTLSYVVRNNSEVLLALKKRGFTQGKWNGPGGKALPGEIPVDSAIREVMEEVSIRMLNPISLGYIDFIWPKQFSDNNQRCHIFYCDNFTGNEAESEECFPSWFPISEIPYEEMWDDDKIWYPKIFSKEKIKMRIFFDDNSMVANYEEIN